MTSSPPATDGTAQRLPRGRHGLSRSEVARSQRVRMLRAMADAMVEKGYVGTSVADVIRRAGVSRETFYQQFSSKEDCFMGAYDAAVEIMLARAPDPDDEAAPSPAERDEAFARLLRLYLDTLASEPAFARLFLLEVHAAGPAAMARRAAAQQRFTDVLATVLDAHDDQQRFACEVLVSAISAMVTARLAALDLDGLRALHDPIVALVHQARRGALWD